MIRSNDSRKEAEPCCICLRPLGVGTGARPSGAAPPLRRNRRRAACPIWAAPAARRVRVARWGSTPERIPALALERFPWPQRVISVVPPLPASPAFSLCYPTRINLDGSASGEEIDDAARATATKRLEETAARQARKLAKLAEAEQQRLQD